MKVLAIVGSARKKHTFRGAEWILKSLEESLQAETEILQLSDLNLKNCIGCKNCTDKGEELCPLDDDRDLILEKMANADGLLWAVPNYSFHVSAIMKQFLDRLGFVFHRPSLFGKTSTALVSQGVFGGGKILSYLNFIGKAMGCNTVKGICLTTLEPVSDKIAAANEKKLEKLSRRFARRLKNNQYPQPTFFDAVIFRFSRSKIRKMLSEEYRDYCYYRDKGWFESDFYYPVRWGILKRTALRTVDLLLK